MTETTTTPGLTALRAVFPAEAIGLLPKAVRQNDNDKGACREGTRYSSDGRFCGGWHVRSMHVDFVGHADVTARLLEVDPAWSWEPMVTDPTTGMPLTDRDGNLWIRLTILGVTRPGVGDGANMKIRVGDAIRNAAMRFGVALDLWAKGDREWAKTEDREEPDATPRSSITGGSVRQSVITSGGQRTAQAFAVLTPYQQEGVRANWPKGYPAPADLSDAQANHVQDLLLHWAGQEEPIPPA